MQTDNNMIKDNLLLQFLFLSVVLLVVPNYAQDLLPDSSHLQRAEVSQSHIVSLETRTIGPNAPSLLEKSVYWSTWWGYHISYSADFALTGMIIDKGGREGSPLYTLFGDRNMAGVMGSALAVHMLYSFISLQSYSAVNKRRGIWRFLLFTAATGINTYFLVAHTHAALNNITVYKTVSRP